MARFSTDVDEQRAKDGGTSRGPFPPEGEYPARVVDSYDKPSSKGTPMTVIELEVLVNGEPLDYEKKLFVPHSNEGRVDNMIWALREDGERDFDTENLTGRECRVVIAHEPNASGKVYANVDKLLPASSDGRGGRDRGRGRDRDVRGGERSDRGRGRDDRRSSRTPF